MSLTEQEHRVIGAKLKKQYEELNALIMWVSRVYPKNSKPVRDVKRCIKSNISLRNTMDDQLFKDNPNIKHWQGIYYGPAEKE